MNFSKLLLPLAIWPVLSACGSDDAPSTKDLSISFSGLVGAEPFACGRSYTDVGSNPVSVTPRDFRFYVHNVRLVDDKGTDVAVTLDTNDYQYGDVAMLDFEDATGDCIDGDAATHTAITGAVPSGTYAGLKFTLGIPFDKNHLALDSQPSPLNKSALFWGWGMGHIFIAATTRGTMTTASSTVTVTNDHFTHIGSTGCEGDPETGTAVTSCSKPNRTEYAFADFDVEADAVAADFAAIKKDVDVMDGIGCHSFDEDMCAKMFDNLGIDFATGAPKTVQSVMHKK